MLNRINYRGLLPLSATRRGVSVCALTVIASLAFSTPALAQSTQAAHNQGMSLGTSELNRVGTSNITQQNAQELVPFYKENPVQKNDTRTDANFFFETGVNQINSSRVYTSGNCDREGFNPEAEARKGVGEEKWARMTAAQKSEAIQNQVTFFDQECEGINFLAGEYPNRTKVEIDPGSDLGQWSPPEGNPDIGEACRTETVYTPDKFEQETCYETAEITEQQCHLEATVRTWSSGGMAKGWFEIYYTTHNHNESGVRLIINETGRFTCSLGRVQPPGTACTGSDQSTAYLTMRCNYPSEGVNCVNGTNRFVASQQSDGCTVHVERYLPNGSHGGTTRYSFCSPRAPGEVTIAQAYGSSGYNSYITIDRLTSRFIHRWNLNYGPYGSYALNTTGSRPGYYVAHLTTPMSANGHRGFTEFTVEDLPDGCNVRLTRTSQVPYVASGRKYPSGVYGAMLGGAGHINIPPTQSWIINFCRPDITYDIEWNNTCMAYENVVNQ